MASGFDYRTLQSSLQEIRVLCIDPDRNASDLNPLRYEMKHISLQIVPVEHFLAVSYCWGTSKTRASIVLDGQNVTIPHSTAVALRNLSKVFSCPLWIDAVCIDQNNLREKSQQVAMMGQVYSKAASVIIWLGPSQSSTANAIISVKKIYEQCLEVIGDLKDLNAHLYGSDGSPGFKYSDAPLPDCDWPALQAFYSAHWFGRLWVIQEIGLAQDSTVYVGSFSIGAEKVVLAARWMVHRKYARYCGGSDSPGVESASSLYRPAGRPLANQLRRTHRAGCRDARDKVYGLLGLLHEETASAIVADYTKPLVDVYAHAIRLALHEARLWRRGGPTSSDETRFSKYRPPFPFFPFLNPQYSSFFLPFASKLAKNTTNDDEGLKAASIPNWIRDRILTVEEARAVSEYFMQTSQQAQLAATSIGAALDVIAGSTQQQAFAKAFSKWVIEQLTNAYFQLCAAAGPGGK
ncbi:MAG: hypothetical protein Q9223_001697 [Gallowayella weberi]